MRNPKEMAIMNEQMGFRFEGGVMPQCTLHSLKKRNPTKKITNQSRKKVEINGITKQNNNENTSVHYFSLLNPSSKCVLLK